VYNVLFKNIFIIHIIPLLTISPVTLLCQPQTHANPARTKSAISLTITSANPSCGYNNGTINVIATGGTAPYIYYLGGVAHNNGYFPGYNADSGIPYDILVTDAAGDSATAHIVLTDILPPPALMVNTINLPGTCTSADGSVSLTGTGGVPPYQYSIDRVNFSSNNIFSNLTNGTYRFFVKDANGSAPYGDATNDYKWTSYGRADAANAISKMPYNYQYFRGSHISNAIQYGNW